MEKQTRRGLLKNAAAAAVAATGAVALVPQAQAQAGIEWKKKAVKRAPSGDKVLAPTPGAAPDKPPLFNGIISFGNLVFLAGVGAHFQGTIEEHTKHVLDELEGIRAALTKTA